MKKAMPEQWGNASCGWLCPMLFRSKTIDFYELDIERFNVASRRFQSRANRIEAIDLATVKFP
jgi:hypothetical protein